jgi:hypothetical protein
MLISTHEVSACGDAMSGRRDGLSACIDAVSCDADKVSADADRVSCGRDKVSTDAICLSACAYSVYGSKDGMSSGRNFMPGLGYEVSACFDQMPA